MISADEIVPVVPVTPFTPLVAADTVDALRLDSVVFEHTVTDLVRQINAGAALAHAIYHGGKDFALSMPDPVARAYMRACEAYGIGHGR